MPTDPLHNYDHAAIETFVCLGCGTTFLRKCCVKNRPPILCKICAPSVEWMTRFRKYGITKPQFDEMFEKQSGLCDLCEKPLPQRISYIAVEHCHKQGHVRALTCRWCNTGLGYIENDKWLAAAFRYIERHRR